VSARQRRLNTSVLGTGFAQPRADVTRSPCCVGNDAQLAAGTRGFNRAAPQFRGAGARRISRGTLSNSEASATSALPPGFVGGRYAMPAGRVFSCWPPPNVPSPELVWHWANSIPSISAVLWDTAEPIPINIPWTVSGAGEFAVPRYRWGNGAAGSLRPPAARVLNDRVRERESGWPDAAAAA